MTADEIARIRAEALEEAARAIRGAFVAANGQKVSRGNNYTTGLQAAENLVRRMIERERPIQIVGSAAVRALIPSPPLVDQSRQERVEDRLDEPEHSTPVHDTVRGVDEHPAAVDTDEARGGVLGVDLGHGGPLPAWKRERLAFIQAYCDRSGIPDADRTETGFDLGGWRQYALPCDCGDPECEGWAMVSEEGRATQLYRVGMGPMPKLSPSASE